MRHLSEENLQRVSRLFQLDGTSFWWGDSKRSEAIKALLKQLGESGEISLMYLIDHFTMSGDLSIRAVARAAISDLVSSCPPEEIGRFGEYKSFTYGWNPRHSWNDLTIKDVTEIAGLPGDADESVMLGQLSFHHNGYIRHEAVRRLSKITDGSELPYLLIRQNDWVKPLAKDAQKAVVDRLTDEYLPHFVRSLKLVLHLSNLRRHDQSGIVIQIFNLLLDDRHNAKLQIVMRYADREVRRQFTRYSLELPGSHHARILTLGAASDDVVVRRICCRHLPSAYQGPSLLSALEQPLTDRSTSVRREAILLKVKTSPELSKATWEIALTDKSRSIRELARFSLGKLGEPDVATFYRRLIVDRPDLLPAIQGLAENAEESDISYFRQLLQHPLPSR